ncbi:MAG TPA: hypothetical protein VMF66_16975 [Candidatus Acidoferrum sp.]|nr:hypothetical protein [Candidatus Acidoferrum sp.]
MLRQIQARLRLTILFALFPLSLLCAEQKHASRAEKEKAASLPVVLWRNPGDVSRLNLLYGEGGRRDAPNPTGRFVFVKEDMHGSNPKFDVVDQEGREWKVKLGKEARPEVAATRIVWAAGYFVDEDYFLPSMKVDKLPRLRRGEKSVSAGGIVHDARLELERKDVRKLGDWSWFHSPFEHTKELNGLRVIMCLVDNWDLKDDNNSVYQVGDQRFYLVSDLGSSFGKTGNYFTRSKGVLKNYSRAKFIQNEHDDLVDLVMHSRPVFFFMAFHRSDYRERARIEMLGKDIPVPDARWIGRLLGRLSAAQLRDCFRAAGYDSKTADVYASTVEKRIAELNHLQPRASSEVSAYEADRSTK